MSDSLQARELQHARLPCPSPSPGTHSNTCSSSWWRHPTISFSVSPFSSCPQSSPASVFSNESAVCIRWPQYWSFSFSISPSNEYSGWFFFFFRIDWFDLLAFQGTLKESSSAPLFKSINSLAFSLLYGLSLTSQVWEYQTTLPASWEIYM